MKKSIFAQWFAVGLMTSVVLLGARSVAEIPRRIILQRRIRIQNQSLSIRGAAAAGKGRNATDPRLDMVTALQARGPHTSLGDQAKVFGRFVGTWDAEYTEFSKDGKTTHSPGEFIVGWVMDGRAMQDLFIVYPSAAHKEKFIGTVLHYFDPKSGTWRVTFIDPENDSVARFTGGVEGDDRIVLHSPDAYGKEARWSFNDMRPDSFVFRIEESGDGGKNWLLVEEDHMKRRGEAPPSH